MSAVALVALAALGAVTSGIVASTTQGTSGTVTSTAQVSETGPAIESGTAIKSGASCPRGCMCYPGVESRLEYECALPGGGALQLTVSARERWLKARCEAAPRLPAADALPQFPFADVIDAKFTACRAGAGGWAAVLNATGASAALRRLTLDYLNNTEPAGDGAWLTEQLRGLPALELLKISGWGGSRLPASLAVAVPALRDLRLSGAEGRGLPALKLEADSLALPALTRLELTGVGLALLPAAALGLLPGLKQLFLWRNRLTELEAAALAGTRALESVDLSGNAGLRVPARLLADLPALREVSLRDCRLATLPADTFAGSHALRTLLLANNNLRELPPALLRDQQDLRKLDLSGNSLEALSTDVFASLIRLEYLNLERNNLTSLPGGVFSGLRGVQMVSLAYNRLHTISPASFGASPALARLVLAHNNLTTLCAAPQQSDYWSVANSPFETLKDSLQYLNLSHNRIQTLCDDWKHLFLKLRSLDLSYNDFKELTDADFNFLSDTVVVDWRHNRIKTARLSDVYEAASAATPGSEQPAAGASVLLDDNPLICDCELYELARRLHAPVTAAAASVRDQPVCAEPPELALWALRAVPLDAYTCALPGVGDGAACPAACACALVPRARELRLTCVAAPPPAAWPALPPGAEHFSLRLTAAPAAAGELALPAHVHTLNLSGLGLLAVPHVSAPAPLRLLDLRGNLLRVAVPPADPATRLLLADNDLACDCEHAADVATLQRHKNQVDDWELLQCASVPDGGARLRLAGTSAAALCPALPGWLAALAALAALLAAACVLACWRWERELRMLLGCCWRRPDDDEEREYDAFVAYAHQDEEWVSRELVPRLEAGARPLRLCLHCRDWEVGEYISKQIHRSVARSRRTLVVLSDDFLRSAWASAEFRAAYLAETQERRTRLLVVMLRPPSPVLLEALPELKAHLKTTTYVQVGSPFFWSILRKALPPGRERAPCELQVKPAAGGLDVRLAAGGLVNVAGAGA